MGERSRTFFDAPQSGVKKIRLNILFTFEPVAKYLLKSNNKDARIKSIDVVLMSLLFTLNIGDE